MASLGGGSPLPFQLGGGPSIQESYYRVLKSLVGIGGSGDDGSIIEAWRMARARGMAGAFADDRAAHQVWPDTVTDFIPLYEEMLGLIAGPGLSDQERREKIIEKMIDLVDSVHDPLEVTLQEIDSRFSIIEESQATTTTTQHGRGFEDWNPTSPAAVGPEFGDDYKATDWPNTSTNFVCQVRYAIIPGELTATDKKNIATAKAALNTILPAWVDFWIVNDTSRGFILDTDLLDIGCFGEVIRGSHTGSGDVAVLSDWTKNWAVDSLVGRYVYNTTDGSKGLITANTATNATATLGGGSEDDWDTGDLYQIP